jgi:hypothetical protein
MALACTQAPNHPQASEHQGQATGFGHGRGRVGNRNRQRRSGFGSLETPAHAVGDQAFVEIEARGGGPDSRCFDVFPVARRNPYFVGGRGRSRGQDVVDSQPQCFMRPIRGDPGGGEPGAQRKIVDIGQIKIQPGRRRRKRNLRDFPTSGYARPGRARLLG